MWRISCHRYILSDIIGICGASCTFDMTYRWGKGFLQLPLPHSTVDNRGLSWGNKLAWSRETKNSHNGTQSPSPQPLVWMHSGIRKSPERTGQVSWTKSLNWLLKKLMETILHEETRASVGTTFFVRKITSSLLRETQMIRFSNISQQRMKHFTSRQHMFNKIKENVWLCYQLWFLVEIWEFHSIFMRQSTWKHVSVIRNCANSVCNKIRY